MTTVYIALGSNLDNPKQQIKTAVEALKKLPDSTFLTVSSLHTTKPQGFLDQPDFINAVCAIETNLAPYDLLLQLHRIEENQGRVRTDEKNQPRTLDLDLLLYGDLILEDNELSIPHPRLKERAFVLFPLAEIAPDLQLPTGEYVDELTSRLG